MFDEPYRSGRIDLELVPQGNLAARVAQHIFEGAVVNLGVGQSRRSSRTT